MVAPMLKLRCCVVVLVSLFAALASLSCSNMPVAAMPGEAAPPTQSIASASASAVASTAAANFDYYVLALSWSPQHCSTPAGRRDPVQCGGVRPYSFIVHGLWPQYEKGWPQDCGGGGTLSGKVIQQTFDIMPSEGLIRHEWRKHGTCSGLSPENYFALARKAFSQFRAPADYGQPDREIYVSPAKYKQAWEQANPGLNRGQFAVLCSGRFLQEVRICLDKNLNPRPFAEPM